MTFRLRLRPQTVRADQLAVGDLVFQPGIIPRRLFDETLGRLGPVEFVIRPKFVQVKTVTLVGDDIEVNEGGAGNFETSRPNKVTRLVRTVR